MFETMTAYLSGLQSEGPSYYRAIPELSRAIGQFANDHSEDMGLYHYQSILEAAGIRWNFDSMVDADASSLDGKTVVALFLGAVRAERFSDGAFLEFVESGCVVKWLLRLQKLDLAERYRKHYRIFVSVAGGFTDSSKYEFVAEFADQKVASFYVQYMFGKERYQGKDIIIKEVDVDGFDPKDGRVDGVVTSLGEELSVEEYDFI